MKKNLVFQTPEFTISQYGIPGEMFAKLPIQRKTLKLPLDDQPECKLMETMFTQIDTWMKKEQAKTFSVGNLNKLKFSYKSIVREPRVDTVIEDPKKKNIKQEPINAKPRVPKCKFWKAKLDLEFPSEDIQTIVYLKDPTNPNDKPQRVYDVKSADDLEKYMPWGSKVRLIVMMNKMWAEKNPKDGDSDVRKFGLTFKVLSIETTPRQKNNQSIRDALAEYAFATDDVPTDNKQDDKVTETVDDKVVEEKETDPEADPEADPDADPDAEDESEEEPEPVEPPKPVEPLKPVIKESEVKPKITARAGKR